MTVDIEARIRVLEDVVPSIIRRAEALKHNDIYWQPSEDDWSVMKVLAHVAEILPYWAQQAKNVSERAQNDLPFGRTHEDPDRVAAVEMHAEDTLADVVPRIRQGLDRSIVLLRSIPEDRWQTRTGRHERRGEMTVERMVDDFMVDHIKEHSEQLDAILEGLRRG